VAASSANLTLIRFVNDGRGI